MTDKNVETIDITNIIVNNENARHGKLETEKDAILWLLSNNSGRLESLAKDKSLTDLKHNYSEFFYPSEEYTKTDDEGYILEDAQEPLVSKYHFEELHKSLLEFWKSVPDKIIVDVNKLGKKD